MREVLNFFPTELTDTGDVRVEVSQETASTKTATDHSTDSDTFVHLVGGGGPCPHWVGAGE